ncbi:MAG TPA: FAD-dependent oxidoreductase [bacterium]|nr:FAD-dependent oxidoreductase [bacterium]HOL34827.1 FAD-dependent oxidoreductase [bacterium]HPP07888.1 FAD-dependent oxidoreductase [bacterium]
MNRTDYLIIGNSVCGVNAIEGIREYDPKGEILVLSDEPFENYSRPLISYYLGGKISQQQTRFRDESFYSDMKAQLLVNNPAVFLDCRNHEIKVSKGRKIRYKKLLIATGAKPWIPAIDGFANHLEGIFTFYSMNDAISLAQYIQSLNPHNCVILGAGLIGLKAAEGLLMRKIPVTIVEMADRILPNTMDVKGSEIFQSYLVRHNSAFMKNDTIVKIESKDKRIKRVILKSGKKIETECLIVAVGVRPNTSIVAESSILVKRGIIVDNKLNTSVPDIFAAGDVTESPDFFENKHALIPIWPVAAKTGKIAGANMTGQEISYTGLYPMNSIQIFGLPAISFGITNPQPQNFEILEKYQPENNFYRKCVLRDDRIVGCILIGNINRAGIYNLLIREKISVAAFKKDLLEESFGFLMLPKEVRKHIVVGESMEV